MSHAKITCTPEWTNMVTVRIEVVDDDGQRETVDFYKVTPAEARRFAKLLELAAQDAWAFTEDACRSAGQKIMNSYRDKYLDRAESDALKVDGSYKLAP